MAGRVRRGVAVVTAILLAVTGCSGVRVGQDGELAGHVIEVAAIWTGAEQETFLAVMEAFERRTGARVRYTSGGDDLPALLNSRLAGGSPPDVALLGQPGVVAQLARRGALHPLTGSAFAAVNTHYDESWLEFGRVDGELYAIPYKVANKSVIWYRTDAFQEAGVTPPKTWEELVDATGLLGDAGVGAMAVPGADGWVLTDWFENVYLRLAGPERYDQLARHELPWTDPTVVATLELLAEYWTRDRAIQDSPLQLTFSQAVADVFGPRPKSAMLFEADFVAVEINKLAIAAIGPEARFFEFPSVDASPRSVVTAGDLAVMLRDTPGARALITFLASPEAAEMAVARGGFLSANRSVDLSAYPDATTRDLAASLLEAEVLRFDLSDLAPQSFGGGTNASMWRLLQEFLADPRDPVAIAERLEVAAQRDWGRSA